MIRGCAGSWIFGFIDFQHFEFSRADAAHVAFYISKCFNVKRKYTSGMNSFIILFLLIMVRRNYLLSNINNIDDVRYIYLLT